eukprot:1189376-Prorocentrum_minimum.AAC.2
MAPLACLDGFAGFPFNILFTDVTSARKGPPRGSASQFHPCGYVLSERMLLNGTGHLLAGFVLSFTD